MIASGVLRKENKKVLSDEHHTFRGKSKRDYKSNELQEIKKKILKLRSRMNMKQHELSGIFEKDMRLSSLMARNK